MNRLACCSAKDVIQRNIKVIGIPKQYLFRRKCLSHLSKQARQIEGVLSSINPLNAGKKRDEATALLIKWFPDMEDFETMVRGYKKAIDSLTVKNRDPAEKATEARNGSIKTELEIGTLQSNLRQLWRFVDSIPDDMKRQIRQMQHEKHRDERTK